MAVKKVMCFGTFDGLHPGHLSYLAQAKKYGDYLIVVVARDKTVEKIKGRLPDLDEKMRLREVESQEIVDKAVLGQIKNKFAIIKKYSPDVAKNFESLRPPGFVSTTTIPILLSRPNISSHNTPK